MNLLAEDKELYCQWELLYRDFERVGKKFGLEMPAELQKQRKELANIWFGERKQPERIFPTPQEVFDGQLPQSLEEVLGKKWTI